MRCPDCKKHVDSKTKQCPYCGAFFIKEQQVIDKQDSTTWSVQNIKERCIQIAINSVVVLACFLIWRVVIANIYAPIFGETVRSALSRAVDLMRGRIIILTVLGMFAYFLYSMLIQKTSKPLIFFGLLVVLCVIGLLIFFPITNITILDESSYMILYFCRGLMFLYGFGIPMLQGALCLTMDNHKKIIKYTGMILISFVVGIVIGTFIGMRRMYIGSITVGFSFVYALMGAVMALVVSIVLNWRNER